MAPSYRDIDYRLRPAKFAERLMLCDAFRRLRFGTVESYQYLGLGSVYFSDFALLHRSLGIQRMMSIEKATHDRERFEANFPFSNIEMLWGPTTTQLENVDLSLRTIAWLDYDGRLSRSILDDARTFSSRVTTGSVLVVSVQCNPELDDSSDRSAILALGQEFGPGRIDPTANDEALMAWGTARIFRKAINAEIETVLSQRNGLLPASQRFVFEQIFNFHYRDGARMLTTGGVFFDVGQRGIFNQCSFDELAFVRSGDTPFEIAIPKLTSRELRKLEAQMPLLDKLLDCGSMPEKDARQYADIYRYFPNFSPVAL